MPKAVDVEDLVVWAFRDQKIEAVAARLAGPSGLQPSPESNLAQVLALGCRVQTSSAGAMHMAVQCHEDAAVIYDAVMALPAEATMLLIRHGRNGTRPDWIEDGPGRWVCQVDKAGNPKKLYIDPHAKRGFIGYARPVLEGNDPAEVEEARRAYDVWRYALVDLVPLLNAEMVDHEALLPAVAVRPWEFAEGALTVPQKLT
ncbi:hypothetical protein [Devosia sp. 63-57]|uniref:hypothetical protein n=1 Tax=Devosia sp. 63-57 TaxID=1895751 RepID=UPI00086B9FAE|nr:hypothetical protein [Devosia sp. 63-57]ODT50275.1 MAG: hypothetical protein ABS74_04990 [Pelagibacterium sp. SCN 63-126]ODU82739.1 MAG: hypothetical protein ABT14_16480 [Pelagibacterium sp. SCN 63-17]OJX45019.1 MAG: hypothetical protein BGO80_03990 [Devosia sp. 63-57]